MSFVNSCKAYLARGSRIKRFLHDEETFEYQPLGLEIDLLALVQPNAAHPPKMQRP